MREVTVLQDLLDDQVGWVEELDNVLLDRVDSSNPSQATPMTPPHISLGTPTKRATPIVSITWPVALSALERWSPSPPLPAHTAEQFQSLDVQEALWNACLPDTSFVAGLPNTRVTEWRLYFAWANAGGPLTRDQDEVFKWLQHGVKVQWVGVYNRHQQAHPRFRQRLALVRELLQSTFPLEPQKAQELLKGDRPGHVVFPNRASVQTQMGFVVDAITELLSTGAVEEVTEAQVQVCSGLAVVVNHKGKARLILDARYINLFDKYVPFSYEQLQDIPLYAQEEDVLCLTDFKSGYHHFSIHPADRPFLGFQLQQRFFRFKVLPFGLSSACRVYTTIMQQVYQPLRDKGLRMSFLIDDACYLFKGHTPAQFGITAVLCLFTFLGFCFSRQKCLTVPNQQGKFLGLLVDLQKMAFAIPADKAAYILAEWDKARQTGYSKRTMARIAGMLVSVAPAVRLAPLYIRRLFQAMGTTGVWDAEMGEEAAGLAEQDYMFWKAVLQKGSFKKWAEKRPMFSCAGDASATGYGGFSEDLLPRPMVESFTLEEQALMDAGKLSSCHREVRNMCLLVKTCLSANPEKLRGAELVVFCDNMGAVANLNAMNGKPHTLAEIRDLLELAMEHDVTVRAQWLPRTNPLIQEADALSRVEDTADFALANHLFQRVCKFREPGGAFWGFPTGDCFAGTAPGFHKSPRYFTKHPAPAGIGADALHCAWQSLDPPTGSTPLLWAFPPRELIRQVIQKIGQEGRNTILLVTNFPHKWKTWLTHLPVVDEKHITPTEGMFLLGSRFPVGLRTEGAFQCHISCFLIKFHQHKPLQRSRTGRKRGRQELTGASQLQ